MLEAAAVAFYPALLDAAMETGFLVTVFPWKRVIMTSRFPYTYVMVLCVRIRIRAQNAYGKMATWRNL